MTDPAGPQHSAKAELVSLIPRLRRFAYALTGSRDEADDLAQLALERALLKLHQWSPGSRLDSWLFRIAHNAWIDEMRARRRRGPVADADVLETIAGADGRVVSQARLDLAEVREAVAALPQEQRAVLAMVAIEGLSYQDAADALDIPIGTVMSRLARARKAIAQRLDRREGAGDD